MARQQEQKLALQDYESSSSENEEDTVTPYQELLTSVVQNKAKEYLSDDESYSSESEDEDGMEEVGEEGSEEDSDVAEGD